MRQIAHQFTPRSDNLTTQSGARTTLQWMWEELARFINRKLDVPEVYTIATLPTAANARYGAMAFVTDEAPGSQVKFSDGTNWIDLG